MALLLTLWMTTVSPFLSPKRMLPALRSLIKCNFIMTLTRVKQQKALIRTKVPEHLLSSGKSDDKHQFLFSYLRTSMNTSCAAAYYWSPAKNDEFTTAVQKLVNTKLKREREVTQIQGLCTNMISYMYNIKINKNYPCPALPDHSNFSSMLPKLLFTPPP